MAVDGFERGGEALAAFAVERADRAAQAVDGLDQFVAFGGVALAARFQLGDSRSATRLTGPMRSRSAVRRSCGCFSAAGVPTSVPAKPRRSGSTGAGAFEAFARQAAHLDAAQFLRFEAGGGAGAASRGLGQRLDRAALRVVGAAGGGIGVALGGGVRIRVAAGGVMFGMGGGDGGVERGGAIGGVGSLLGERDPLARPCRRCAWRPRPRGARQLRVSALRGGEPLAVDWTARSSAARSPRPVRDGGAAAVGDGGEGGDRGGAVAPSGRAARAASAAVAVCLGLVVFGGDAQRAGVEVGALPGEAFERGGGAVFGTFGVADGGVGLVERGAGGLRGRAGGGDAAVDVGAGGVGGLCGGGGGGACRL